MSAFEILLNFKLHSYLIITRQVYNLFQDLWNCFFILGMWAEWSMTLVQIESAISPLHPQVQSPLGQCKVKVLVVVLKQFSN